MSRRASEDRPRLTRRRLGLSAASVALLLGCGDDEASPAAGASGGGGVDGAGSGEPIDVLPFVDDGDRPLDELLGDGLDGRLFTDLSTLSPGALITPNDRFYVRTRHPDQLDPSAPWRVTVDGLVDAPSTLALEELLPLVAPRGVHLMECSGNSRGGSFGLMSAAAWDGVAMPDLLAMWPRRHEATRVLVSGFDGHGAPSANGHSTPGASWIFTFAELDRAFLATAMNGAPLPPDHGAPLRLLVPGWYGCTCIKWVDRITLVDDDAPATSQMIEFASRTHQDGVPERARDYRPAIIEQAAMPVRVERWRDAHGLALRTTGILWGGSTPTSAASIRFGDASWEPVTVDPPARQNATWTLWTHTWRPTRRGELPIRMRIDDPAIPTRRLDTDHYLRTIVLPA